MRLPTNVVEVIEVAPVTTPASTTIVPSKTICCPANGVIVKSTPAVEDMSFPLMVMLSIERVVKVPTLVNEEDTTVALRVVPVKVPASAVIVMLAVPSKEVPFMVLAVCNAVAVDALPVKAPTTPPEAVKAPVIVVAGFMSSEGVSVLNTIKSEAPYVIDKASARVFVSVMSFVPVVPVKVRSVLAGKIKLPANVLVVPTYRAFAIPSPPSV